VEDAQPQGRMLADRATGHEANRLRVRWLVAFAAALVGVTVMVLVVAALVMKGFSREGKQLESLALPRFAGDTGEFPAPRIQADPAPELTKMKAADLGRLNKYGWVDRKAGLAHIPVDRAIEILAQKGLPTPEARGVTPGKPAENQGPAERKEQLKPGTGGEPKP
jgi:hypothetical protein